jgi:hypothetical protein
MDKMIKQTRQRKKTEAQEQAAVFEWAKLQENIYPELKLLHAIPNGGSRHILEAVNLKKQGVKSGVPDIHLPVSKGKYHSLYIEMKSEKGKISDNQNFWIEELEKKGNCVWACRGSIIAINVLLWYLNLKDENNFFEHRRL